MKLFRYILRSAFLILLFSIVGKSYAQTYNNEWIDYSKTYYKFKLATTGMYRISGSVIANTGLANTSVNQFQLWRNGKVVPIYISTAGTNTMGASDYIEFYGEQNDGLPDSTLYKDPNAQLSKVYSLETDSSSYFLTANTDTTANRHYVTVDRSIPTAATPEPYFMYTYSYYPHTQIYAGRASSYGEYVYSSTYDIGEGWTSDYIAANGSSFNISTPNQYVLNTYLQGPAATLSVSAAGASVLGVNRTLNLSLNGQTLASTPLNSFNSAILTSTITDLSTIVANTNIGVNAVASPANSNDRFVISKIELTYPRTFNFLSYNIFPFKLEPKSSDIYIQITNFSDGSVKPLLLDLTNNVRYVSQYVTGGYGYYVNAYSGSRRMLEASQELNQIKSITTLTARTFVNPSNNEGNYLIITGNSLRVGTDPVGQYQQYRNSSAGGNFNAQIYDISQLEDQFAWGIRMHPLAVKNFLKYARNKFSTKPEYCFLIGHGLTYDQFYSNQNNTGISQLAIIPTFGSPASDVLLASDNYLPAAATPIGRISAISTDEVSSYLSKIKEYEALQQNQTQTIDEKAWMKNVANIAGGSDENESNLFVGYLNAYSNILTDTLMGGTVYNFNKYTNQTSAALNDVQLRNLFTNGFSLLNYWGHASSTTLDYNLDHASNYNNAGKYPIMYINGCDVAGYYNYDANRLTSLSTIPEDFILTPNAGAIGFIAQSYLGVTDFLQNYSLPFYQSLGTTNYEKPLSLSQIFAATKTTVNPASYPGTNGGDTLATNAQAEGNLLLGDPYVSLNAFAKPDFDIEDASVTISPSYIDISQTKFHVKAYIYNLGRATGDSLLVQIKRNHPNGTSDILFNKNIKAVRYKDSIELDVPISGNVDQGQNSVSFSLDPNNQYDELSKLNNTLTKNVFIYEVGLTPIYPYKYSIVNKQNIKLIASTANPIAATTQYAMEIDTSTLFNSALKVRKTLTSFGGALEFDPGISFSDSTVYYWRVSPIPTSGDYHWNVSSFLYLGKATKAGFNQSHLYQQFDSETDRISLDSNSRVWNFANVQSIVEMQNAILQASGQNGDDFAVSLNGTMISEYYCGGNSIAFVVLEPNSMKPYYNSSTPSITPPSSYTTSFMGSYVPCIDRDYCIPQQTFEFEIGTEDQRNKVRDFMDWIPNGAFVAVRNCYFPYWSDLPKAAEWKVDGSNSMYSRLVDMGFSTIDNYNAVKAWSFSYKKNDKTYTPVIQMSAGTDDKIQTSTIFNGTDTLGYITSPNFGPAKKWYTMLWDGYSQETTPGDKATVDLIGVNSAGQETTLRTVDPSQKSVDISDIDATTYPYIKFYMRNSDSINYTPYQLKYWRLLYDAVPEGALAANVYYKSTSDSVTKGADYSMDIAFKNIGDVPFEDSLKVNYTLTDKSNVAHLFSLSKLKPLASGDTTLIHISVPGTDTTSRNLSTNIYTGSNTQYLDVNPDNTPIEQTHANNFLSQPLYVSGDDGDVSLDITFDGVHILNNDIVASTPKIIAKLTSDSKYQLLSDTSLLTLQLKYPDGTLKRIKYGTDTLLFTGAKDSSDNAALANFAPYLTQDGTYELIVQGKSTTASTSVSQYSISFQVYNKPMISDMFNYPNPFTTSTAFVFTLTGSVVPQNLRIEILTITGKIVKEITKAELGPLKIGRNITEYKWDGTDQYGQKLANGVYIYRVITNLDGKKLDKFNVTDTNGNSVNTGQYFNKGYGKMYLMR